MIFGYTDGGVSRANKIGGWGVVFVYEDGSREAISGFEEGGHVTNNTMEISAVIEGLKFLDHHHPGAAVTIVSDSEYVVKGVTEWSPRWIRNGWRGVGGSVKNQEYWKFLLPLVDKVKPTFQWVRGHDGNENNEIVDKLCVQAYTDQLTKRKSTVS